MFLPGAPEIARLVRSLQGSSALQRAADGQQLRVLPLHGALPPSQQVRLTQPVSTYLQIGAGLSIASLVPLATFQHTFLFMADLKCVEGELF